MQTPVDIRFALKESGVMNQFSRQDSDDDKDIYPKVINDEVRDGIEKMLQHTDLTPEDRQSYENALANLDKEESDSGSSQYPQP